MRLREAQSSEVDEEETESSGDSELECECGSTDISTHTNETYCEDCGMVLDENHIDHGPEWRAFNQSERDEKARVGSPETLTMHDRGLTTKMGSMSGENVSARRKQQIKRLRKWDTRSKQTSKERGLKFALGELGRVGSEMDLPQDVRESAAKVLRDAHDEDIIKGRSFEGMVGACIYIACREKGMSRRFVDIAEFSRVDKKKIYQSYKKLLRNTDLQVQPPDPQEYVARTLNELRDTYDLDFQSLEVSIRDVLEDVKSTGVHSGKSPTTVVAGAVYLVARKNGMPLTSGDVGAPVDVSGGAIDSIVRDMCSKLDISVPDDNCVGQKFFSVEGLGMVRGEERERVGELLVEKFGESGVHLDDRFDFRLDSSVANYVIDIAYENQSAKPTSATHVVLAADDIDYAPCDYAFGVGQAAEVVQKLTRLE